MPEKDSNKCWEALLKLTPEQALERKREWNRDPLADLFPRIPSLELDRVLELLIAKDFVYDLSQSRLWNARRYSSLTVACVRHWFSDYDKLLREGTPSRKARRFLGRDHELSKSRLRTSLHPLFGLRDMLTP